MRVFKGLIAIVVATSLAAAAQGASSEPGGQLLLSEAQFETLFPKRLAFYSYQGFVAAARSFPAFAGEGPAEQRWRELAAFLGQIAHESDELRALREYRRENYDHYCRLSEPGDACAKGQQYYGRGPIQLSWNYQYKAAGQALGLDLWADPDRVARDPRVAWQTALWYWMTQPGPGTMTAHQAMVSGAGFGETVRSINGVIECDKPGDREVARKLARRADFYRRAATLLGVSPDTRLGC
ncbi:chitinase [Roseateles cavernae]|uniref:chitinase n=1 Tax=Roseateles cavernae TaxID=3153578 RepID=UPI0032E38744